MVVASGGLEGLALGLCRCWARWWGGKGLALVVVVGTVGVGARQVGWSVLGGSDVAPGQPTDPSTTARPAGSPHPSPPHPSQASSGDSTTAQPMDRHVNHYYRARKRLRVLDFDGPLEGYPTMGWPCRSVGNGSYRSLLGLVPLLPPWHWWSAVWRCSRLAVSLPLTQSSAFSVITVISLGAKIRNGGPQKPLPLLVYSWVRDPC